MGALETLRFMDEDRVRRIAREIGTPVFVYDRTGLEKAASAALSFPNAFGLTARYAMKANPNAAILRIFDQAGLHIDASSGYEAERALRTGIAAEKIMLTGQEMPANLEELANKGVLFNATSLRQLEAFGEAFAGGELSVRINPGLGSGGTNRTNVGGPASSFGVWHEALDEVFALVAKYELRVTKLHTHIGSGSDPAVWQKVALMSLEHVERFADVQTLNLGGGYKVGRMQDEESTDLQVVGEPVREAIEQFAARTGRKIKMEIEPGTFLVANAGALIATVQDTAATGEQGYEFLKLDAGMTEVMRPAMYGAQHPVVVVPAEAGAERETRRYIVAGHCCESGDILTPAPNDPEGLQPRCLREGRAGDFVVIEGTGAYCSGMCARNYNSFPIAAEVLLQGDRVDLIRQRQNMAQMIENEVLPGNLGGIG